MADECSRFDEIADWPAAERSRHLRACPACRRQQWAADRLHRYFQAEAPPELSGGFADRVVARVETPPASRGASWLLPLYWAASGAASLWILATLEPPAGVPTLAWGVWTAAVILTVAPPVAVIGKRFRIDPLEWVLG